jgi:hypothetical protein
MVGAHEQPIPEGTPESGGHTGTHTTIVSLAAFASVIAASSCCLPLLPFLMAAGLAGSSAFLSAARRYLLVVSILLIAYGFYQSRRARQCDRRPSVLASILLWLSATFVLLSILFPQLMANAAASLLPR